MSEEQRAKALAAHRRGESSVAGKEVSSAVGGPPSTQKARGSSSTAPPSSPTPRQESGSRRNALVLLLVVGTAAVGFGFMIASALQRQPTPAPAPRPAASSSESGLTARAATSDFRPRGGEPPSDVLAALPVPEGSVAAPLVDKDAGGSTYDRSVSYRTTATYQQVVAFYLYSLAARKWTVQGDVQATGISGEQIISRHSGSDGFYWEAGITVYRPRAAASSPTRFAIRLYQVDDQ